MKKAFLKKYKYTGKTALALLRYNRITQPVKSVYSKLHTNLSLESVRAVKANLNRDTLFAKWARLAVEV